MEVPTLTVVCHEGPWPADDIYLMAAARSQYLLELLDQVPDPRKRRGRRHPLAGLLGEVFCHLRHRYVVPGQSRAAQAARRRRRPRGRCPPPPFLDPSRDRLPGVSAGETARPRDAPGQRLIKSTLRCALQDPGHLGQQVGPATGELAERGHLGGLLVDGEFTPSGPSPVMSQQPDHLRKLAPVVS